MSAKSRLVMSNLGRVLTDMRGAVQEIIDDEGSVWERGPHGVWVCIMHPGIDMVCGFFGHQPKDWPQDWEPFSAFAVVKASLSMAEYLPSEECTLTPFLKANDLARNWKGGIYLPDANVAIGSSGLTEESDARVSRTLGYPVAEVIRLVA